MTSSWRVPTLETTALMYSVTSTARGPNDGRGDAEANGVEPSVAVVDTVTDGGTGRSTIGRRDADLDWLGLPRCECVCERDVVMEALALRVGDMLRLGTTREGVADPVTLELGLLLWLPVALRLAVLAALPVVLRVDAAVTVRVPVAELLDVGAPDADSLCDCDTLPELLDDCDRVAVSLDDEENEADADGLGVVVELALQLAESERVFDAVCDSLGEPVAVRDGVRVMDRVPELDRDPLWLRL